MHKIIGTCSLCGGSVTIPDVWAGIIPPTPTCSSCGAMAANYGPVIPMMPKPINPYSKMDKAEPFNNLSLHSVVTKNPSGFTKTEKNNH